MLGVIAAAAERLEVNPGLVLRTEAMTEEDVRFGQHQIPREEDRGEQERLEGTVGRSHFSRES